VAAYAGLETCRVRWVCDLDAARAAEVIARVGQGAVAPTFDAIVADPAVDVVSIASYDDVHGSLIALNTAASEFDCAATVTSKGHNLLTDLTGCTGFDRPTDLLTANPKIGTLGSNGGPTRTIPLKPASPAADAGGMKCPKVDQRGVPRPQGPRCDIGAFERRR